MSTSWFDDLWIGDVLRTKESGLYGKYEGMTTDGQVIWRRGKEVHHLPVEEVYLEVFDEEVYEASFGRKAPKKKPKPADVPIVGATIDLHLTDEEEKKLDHWPGSELSYQVDKCKRYLTAAAEQNHDRVVIIHGKGAGILRFEVHQLLGEHEDVVRWGVLDAGNTQVWLKQKMKKST